MKSGKYRHRRLAVGLLALLFSSAALAQSMEPTWVRDGVDWKQYSKFLVKPLNVDDVKVVKPPYAADDPSEWSLQIQDLESVQAIFRDAMKDALTANNGYPLVYSEGPGVLEVEVELLSIMPWLKPGSATEIQGHRVTTLGTGEITARVEISDASTRQLLLMIEGDKAVGEQYQQFTRANNVANIEAMFRAFGQRLRNAMDEVHGK